MRHYRTPDPRTVELARTLDLLSTGMLSRNPDAAALGHVGTLRELGYDIRGNRNGGLDLAGRPDKPFPWEVQTESGLGKNVHYFEELGSTQALAVDMAKQGSRDGVIIAETQGSGFGRLGKKWQSPSGGIWMSIILCTGMSAERLALVPMAASVALAEALPSDVRAELKWPNDVMVDSKKLAGIILDASVRGGAVEYAVLGVGVNHDVNVSDIDARMAADGDAVGFSATSVRAHSDIGRVRLTRRFLAGLESNLGLLARDPDHIINSWSRVSFTLGRQVSGMLGRNRIRGVAKGLNRDGSLAVLTDRGIANLFTSDVVHVLS